MCPLSLGLLPHLAEGPLFLRLPSTTNVSTEVLHVASCIPHECQLQLSFGLSRFHPTALGQWLYSSRAAWPHFCPLCAPFALSASVRSSQFLHAGLWPGLVDVPHIRMGPSCTLRSWYLKSDQLSWTPLPSRVTPMACCLLDALNKPKLAFLKFRAIVLLHVSLTSGWTLGLHCSLGSSPASVSVSSEG